ncbi:Uncharacterised protein [Salmonella enterica subsp. enterica serovar Bovismorbificans]|uniref:Uncharacterized protein n=1 Tax=Salmonella enterica subsp. enterica serovar Bovismorbificans TaxID=58097 RepID=A0A655EEM8_SALET|nr:Uncharacterised protein [Salmonella enterica subsp. enterica serovar Bovismorbificans]CNV17754.1 Uncharacterised protein [Salmonella enterica subsp. enterica serovar Bovismorbificans]
MSRRVDKVQLISFTIRRFKIQRHTLGFNSNTALTLKIHRIKYLSFHFTVRQATADLDNTVRQRRFTVVNVSNDGEISYVLHKYEFFNSLC